MRKVLLAALALVVSGCGPASVSELPIVPNDPTPPPSGTRDAGVGSVPGVDPTDGGPGDAGLADAGRAVDAGPPLYLDAGPSSGRQTPHELGSTAAANGFYEYLPPNYGDGVPRPLMIFWHGFGENGNGTTELSRVLANGPPKLIAHDAWPNVRDYVVLSPQNASGCPGSGEVDAFLTWARANYRVDERRVYLTGLSCGAIGIWAYLGDHAQDGGIAAALLSSGDPGDPKQAFSAWGKQGCHLGDVAIWAFHGTADGTVNIANEEATLGDLEACPSPPRRDAQFSPIMNAGHDVWDLMYSGAGGDVYGWLESNPLP